jgi:hypothetical protein
MIATPTRKKMLETSQSAYSRRRPLRRLGARYIMPENKKKIKANLTIVRIGHLEFEGLLLPDGNFRIAISQLVALNLVPPNRSLKQLQALYSLDFPSHQSILTPLNSKKVNTIDLVDFEHLLRKLDRMGVEEARTIVDSLIGLSLQQLFSDAFCVQFEKEERQAWLKDRQTGKVVRRTLTDAIRDYLKAHDASENAFTFTYPNVTNAINRAIFNQRSAKQLKEDWGVENPRDYMTQNELLLIMEVEHLTMRLIDKDQLDPHVAVKEAISRLCLPVIKR